MNAFQQQQTTTTELLRPDFPGTKPEGPVVTGLRFFTVPEIADLLQMKRDLRDEDQPPAQ